MFSDLIDITSWSPDGRGYHPFDHDALHDVFVERVSNESTDTRPHVLVYGPVYSQLGNLSSPIAGILFGQLAFDFYFGDLLPDGVNGIHAVVSSNCNKSFTYELTGDRGRYLGPGDWHDPAYDGKAVTIEFSDFPDIEKARDIAGHCLYVITLYPTDAFVESYESKAPVIFTSVVAATFLFMIATFFVYDRFVARRNDKVIDAAARSSTIVSSLFPSNVRDRLYAQADEHQVGNHSRLKSFLHEGTMAGGGAEDEVVDKGVSMYKTKVRRTFLSSCCIE